MGSSRCSKPINWRANPGAETTDWRARRGRTAQRVRREGTASAVSYPYPLAEWSRPVFADERPVCIRSPTFGFGPRRRQTAVTLNRSQRSSIWRALSLSARSLRSPLRSKMA